MEGYIRLFRRYWWWIASFVVLGVAGAAVVTIIQKPQYEAVSKAFLSIPSASSVTDLNQGATFSQDLASSYASLATTTYVLDPVIRRLRLDLSAAELAQQVTVTVPAETVIMTITVSDDSSITAARVANAITNELSAAAPDLTPPASSGGAAFQIRQVQTASPSVVPVSPNKPLNFVAGLLLGVALGVATSIARQKLDDRVRAAGDVAELTGAGVLAHIRHSERASDMRLMLDRRAGDPDVESYVTLRTNLRFTSLDQPARTIVVTSALTGEGKSSVAGNLAVALAVAGRRVLLVDADLRRPRQAEYFGLAEGIGLTDLLVDKVTLAEAAQQWGDLLTVMPAGPIPPNPAEMLQSERMKRFIEQARGEFDLVVFDAPPLLPVADAALLAEVVDGVLIVAAAGRVRKAQLASTFHALEQVGGRVLGVVLNRVAVRGPDAYRYDTYGYTEGTAQAPAHEVAK